MYRSTSGPVNPVRLLAGWGADDFRVAAESLPAAAPGWRRVREGARFGKPGDRRHLRLGRRVGRVGRTAGILRLPGPRTPGMDPGRAGRAAGRGHGAAYLPGPGGTPGGGPRQVLGPDRRAGQGGVFPHA